MILIPIIIAIGLVVLAKPRQQRAIAVGHLLYHTEKESEKTLVITEKVRFKNAVECIKNYNQLVAQFATDTNKYKLDSWTYNKFEISNTIVELFRFGNYIKFRKVISKCSRLRSN